MDSRNSAKPVRVFISYRHANTREMNDLRTSLGWLVNNAQITVFDDQKILAGDNWDQEIKKELHEADIIILVVTAEFMASHYCTQVELRQALERRAKDGTRIIPIIAKHCDWETLPIRDIAALPKDDKNNLKPLNKWGSNTDVALTQIAQQVRLNVERLIAIRPRASEAPSPPDATSTSAGVRGARSERKRQAGEDVERQRDREKRFARLKKAIASSIRAPKSIMIALEAELEFRPGSQAEAAPLVDDERAARLVDVLMKADFLDGVSALLRAYRSLSDEGREREAAAIQGASRLLIPWLFVSQVPAGRELDDAWWRQPASGDVLILPTRLRTFAEIVMAGLDRRAAQHRDDDLWWPTGAFAVKLQPPESGLVDATEDNLRADLFLTFRAPSDDEKRDREVRDRSINNQLKDFVRRGFTPYLVCDQSPQQQAERDDHQIRLKGISERYPLLTIVELGELVDLDEHDLLNEVRELLFSNTL